MKRIGMRFRFAAALLCLALLCACAAKPAPEVWIEPPPPTPQYSFSEAPNGGGCLDAAGLAAYETEQELLYSRLEYFHNLLRTMGAKDKPK